MLLSITTAEDLLKKKKKTIQFYPQYYSKKKYCVFLPYLGVGGLGDAKLCRSTRGKNKDKNN